MLKFTYLAQLGLAGIVFVPAVVLEEDPAAGFTDALANTRATIESLDHLHEALTRGDYTKVGASLGATESPAGKARERDEHLAYLRGEVSRLQMRWDALEAAMSAKAPATAPAEGSTVQPLANTPKVTLPEDWASRATTGLDQNARAELVQRLASQGTPTKAPGPQEKTSYEPSGFTAHAVRHGRAYYKAGRYEEALSLLKASTEQAGARFWIACSLEKLGRVEEAITAYEAVMDSPLDIEHAGHAKLNRDSLVSNRDLEARIATAVVTAGETE